MLTFIVGSVASIFGFYAVTVLYSLILLLGACAFLYLKSSFIFYKEYKKYILLNTDKPSDIETIYSSLVLSQLYYRDEEGCCVFEEETVPHIIFIFTWPYMMYCIYLKNKNGFSWQDFIKRRIYKNTDKVLLLTHPDEEVRKITEKL